MDKKIQSVTIEPFFLGPKSENEDAVRLSIDAVLNHWFQWRKSLFIDDPPAITEAQRLSLDYLNDQDRLTRSLEELCNRLRAETPTYTPRYLGHMVSEISLPAILGHFATLLHNPNNTSAEVARVGVQLENEAIGMLLDLVGYDVKAGRGHFTSGGTVANFEAIWRARFRMDHWLSLALYLAEKNKRKLDIFNDSLMGWDRFNSLVHEHAVELDKLRAYSPVASNPWQISNLVTSLLGEPYSGPVVLIPGNKHFSWQKGCNVFGLGEEALWSIPLNKRGHVDCGALGELLAKAQQEQRPVQMVVSVAGTTEAGEIDPIHRVQEVLDAYHREFGLSIWHHIDAAYGGFMCSLIHYPEVACAVASEEQLSALKAISKSSSITMDPHKLGYIPYSCGAFLVPNKQNYMVSQFQAPYLQRTDLTEKKWSTTLEGSRTAAGASATWLTGKTVGFSSETFAKLIANTFQASREFRENLKRKCEFVRPLEMDQTNILCFSVAENGETLVRTNEKSMGIFEHLAESPYFAVSKTVFHISNYEALIREHLSSYDGVFDADELLLVRCVFMNPFWASEALRTKIFRELIEEISSAYYGLKEPSLANN